MLHFEERAVAVVAETGELTLEGPSGRHTVTHEVVIGADGAYSALREAVVRSERADYRQEHLPWGYKELTIAPGRRRAGSRSIRARSTSGPGATR